MARSQARPDRPPTGDRSRTKPAKLLRVAGLPAVTALFAKAPHRVERLFFDQRMRAQVSDFCAELARSRKPYRLVPSEELERVAGSVMHGGIVALAQPQPVPILDLAKAADKAADWARGGEPLLLLDGIGNPHNLGAIVRTAAFFGLPRIVLSDHPGAGRTVGRELPGGRGRLGICRALSRVRFADTLAAAASKLSRHRHRGRQRPADRGAATRASGRWRWCSATKSTDCRPQRSTACDAIVTIPGSGLVQSLNVAASAAILLHALATHT